MASRFLELHAHGWDEVKMEPVKGTSRYVNIDAIDYVMPHWGDDCAYISFKGGDTLKTYETYTMVCAHINGMANR